MLIPLFSGCRYNPTQPTQPTSASLPHSLTHSLTPDYSTRVSEGPKSRPTPKPPNIFLHTLPPSRSAAFSAFSRPPPLVAPEAQSILIHRPPVRSPLPTDHLPTTAQYPYLIHQDVLHLSHVRRRLVLSPKGVQCCAAEQSRAEQHLAPSCYIHCGRRRRPSFATTHPLSVLLLLSPQLLRSPSPSPINSTQPNSLCPSY
ncbi:hypothetical protein DL95DRAFT_14452 [Leptodontidium sp. 2 PMI_412]|nr:hypothetical protein DL95DRAFT_14452 [Leptodontidium sp. 2 PMI_412]